MNSASSGFPVRLQVGSRLSVVVAALWLVAGCAESGSSPPAPLPTAGTGAFGGNAGIGGAAGIGGSAGISGVGGTGGQPWIDAGDGLLHVHIENSNALTVQVVTLQCAGDCVDVVAVSSGGRGALSYRWEDGSTDPHRTLCPSISSAFSVRVSDTPQPDGEFPYPGQTAESIVSAQVLTCIDAGVDAGTDAASGSPCQTNNDCATGSVCYSGTCVGDGGLRFSLSWTLDTDFDLHVITPSGVEIFYANPFADGGQLDVDDCAGACRVPGGPHVENIYFGLNPMRGIYTYWVVNYSAVWTDSYELQAAQGGIPSATQSGTLSNLVLESPRHTFVY